MHHLGTGGMDDDAAQEQRQADDEQCPGDVIGFATGGVDRCCHPWERRRGAQIAGHLVLGDEDEDQGCDAGHHHGQLGVEPHEDREDEGGPEHCHDVLGTEPNGTAPRESLVWCDDFPGFELASVVECPDHGFSLPGTGVYRNWRRHPISRRGRPIPHGVTARCVCRRLMALRSMS